MDTTHRMKVATATLSFARQWLAQEDAASREKAGWSAWPQSRMDAINAVNCAEREYAAARVEQEAFRQAKWRAAVESMPPPVGPEVALVVPPGFRLVLEPITPNSSLKDTPHPDGWSNRA